MNHTEQPTALKMTISLPKLSVAELMFLIQWSGAKNERWPAITKWVCASVMSELERRQNPGSEAGMQALPMWSGDDLADALEASFVLARSPHTDNLEMFVESLARHVLANASAALREFDKAILI